MIAVCLSLYVRACGWLYISCVARNFMRFPIVNNHFGLLFDQIRNHTKNTRNFPKMTWRLWLIVEASHLNCCCWKKNAFDRKWMSHISLWSIFLGIFSIDQQIYRLLYHGSNWKYEYARNARCIVVYTVMG